MDPTRNWVRGCRQDSSAQDRDHWQAAVNIVGMLGSISGAQFVDTAISICKTVHCGVG